MKKFRSANEVFARLKALPLSLKAGAAVLGVGVILIALTFVTNTGLFKASIDMPNFTTWFESDQIGEGTVIDVESGIMTFTWTGSPEYGPPYNVVVALTSGPWVTQFVTSDLSVSGSVDFTHKSDGTPITLPQTFKVMSRATGGVWINEISSFTVNPSALYCVDSDSDDSADQCTDTVSSGDPTIMHEGYNPSNNELTCDQLWKCPIKPVGDFSGVSCTTVSGWACDPNDYSNAAQVPVKLWLTKDGYAAVWNCDEDATCRYIGQITAENNNNASNCGSFKMHGFTSYLSTDLQNWLKTGGNFTIVAQLEDIAVGDKERYITYDYAPNACIPTDAQCGRNATWYDWNDYSWLGTAPADFCAAISPLDPPTPLPEFPEPGQTTGWTCKNPNSGTTRWCEATRETELHCNITATPSSIGLGQTSTISWDIDRGTADYGEMSPALAQAHDYFVSGSGATTVQNTAGHFTYSLYIENRSTLENYTCETTLSVADQTQKDIYVQKSVFPASIDVGDQAEYTLTFGRTQGQTAAVNTISLTDSLRTPALMNITSIIQQPAGLGANPCSIDADQKGITCSFASFPAAYTNPIYTLKYRATGLASGTEINDAVISASPPDSPNTNNSATATVQIGGGATDLSIYKAVRIYQGADPTWLKSISVPNGTVLQYVITFKNNGPEDATGITINDTNNVAGALTGHTILRQPNPQGGGATVGTCAPSGEGISCTIGSLPANSSQEYVISYTAVATTETAGVVNTATIANPAGDTVPANNSSIATTIITTAQQADVFISKLVKLHGGPDAATPTVTVDAGQTVQYVIRVRNLGNTPALDVKVNDSTTQGSNLVRNLTMLPRANQDPTFPDACSINEYGSGITCHFDQLDANSGPYIYRYTAETIAQGTVINTAHIFSNPADTNDANNSSFATVYIGAGVPTCSDFNAVPNPVPEGQATVLDWNQSFGTSAVISDDQGNYFYPPLNGPYSVTPAQTTTYSLVIKDDNAQTVSNACELRVTVTPGNVDVYINKTIEGLSVRPQGVWVDYTLTFGNYGPAPARGVQIDDGIMSDGTTGMVSLFSIFQQPGQGMCEVKAEDNGIFCFAGENVTLPSGATGVVKYRVFTQSEGVVNNRAQISTTTTDTQMTNNLSDQRLTIGAAQLADVSLVKTANPVSVQEGGTVTYTLAYANSGNVPAINVTILDAVDPIGTTGSMNNYVVLPAYVNLCTATSNGVTCNLGNLQPGQTGSVQYTARAVTSGVVKNVAEISTDTNESNGDNNEDDAIVDIGQISADLSIHKSASPLIDVRVGDTITYILTYRNNGPNSVTGAIITDNYDEQELNPNSINLGTHSTYCSNDPVLTTITCNLTPALIGAPGSNGTITYTANARAIGSATNYAHIAPAPASPPDLVSSNNDASATVAIGEQQAADVVVTKTVYPAVIEETFTARYTLTYRNEGNIPAQSVELEDEAAPAGLLGNYVIITQPGHGVCTVKTTGDGIKCSLGQLGVGVGGTIVYEVTGVAVGEVTNTAVISTTSVELDMTDNTDEAELTVQEQRMADLVITKIVTPTQIEVEGTAEYVVRFVNNGNLAATNVTIHDVGAPDGIVGTYEIIAVGTGIYPRPVPIDDGGIILVDSIETKDGGVISPINPKPVDPIEPPIRPFPMAQPVCSVNTNDTGIDCTVSSIPVGGRGYVRYRVTAEAEGTVENTATINTQVPESDTTNNTVQATLNVVPQPDPEFSVTKQTNLAPGTVLENGDTIDYTVTVTNVGAVDADSVNITDVLSDATQGGSLIFRSPATVTTTGEVSCPPTFDGASLICTNFTRQDTVTILYTREVNWVGVPEGGTSNITNTACANFETDEDGVVMPCDNETITIDKPQGGPLSVTKTANPDFIVHGQQTTYTVTVTNATNSSQTFHLNDVMETQGTVINGQGLMGGRIVCSASTVTATFTPANSGQFSGTYPNFFIENLAEDASLQITYTCTGDQFQIPVNATAEVDNTITIQETGTAATETVIVRGPISNGSSGGGSSGGGGSRKVRMGIDLNIQKQVRDENGVWQNADNIGEAAIVEEDDSQYVSYRIQVSNIGKLTGHNIEIEDVFTNSEFARVDVMEVENATWDEEKEVFTIPTVGSGKTVTIRYKALIEQDSDISLDSVGVNTATIIGVDLPPNLRRTIIVEPTEGIGESNQAFIVLGEVAPPPVIISDGTLRKRADKYAVKPGEELTYTLSYKNDSETDLLDVTMHEVFPYEYLDILEMSSRGMREGNILKFNKRILRPGDTWDITIKTRVKEHVTSGTMLINVITITASNQDLTDKEARLEIPVTFSPNPDRHISTGPGELLFLAFILIYWFGFIQLKRKGYFK